MKRKPISDAEAKRRAERFYRDAGKRLKVLREYLRHSPASFAALLGMTERAYLPYERGERKRWTYFAILVSRKTNVSLDWLICGEVAGAPRNSDDLPLGPNGTPLLDRGAFGFFGALPVQRRAGEPAAVIYAAGFLRQGEHTPTTYSRDYLAQVKGLAGQVVVDLSATPSAGDIVVVVPTQEGVYPCIGRLPYKLPKTYKPNGEGTGVFSVDASGYHYVFNCEQTRAIYKAVARYRPRKKGGVA